LRRNRFSASTVLRGPHVIRANRRKSRRTRNAVRIKWRSAFSQAFKRQINVQDRACLDVGASTGGFTDCLLQHGAARVYAVDVGRGQLAWKLRRDPRVVVMEKTNARSLTRASFPKPFAGADLLVADCSFISLKIILPPAVALLRRCGRILALVKPQFEAGRAEADKGAGVITDPAIHARVLSELKGFVGAKTALHWRGETQSPLLGPAGNKEFLVLLEKET